MTHLGFLQKKIRVLTPALTTLIYLLLRSSQHGLEEKTLQLHQVPVVSIIEACDSANSLSSFLSQMMNSSHHHFSSRSPICPFSANTHFHIAIPFYNLDEVTLTSAIKSVTGQHYPKEKITIWVYDDASSLPGSRQVLNNSCGKESIIDFTTPSSAAFKFSNEFLASIGLTTNPPSGIVCFRAARHLGPGGGKYWLFRLIKGVAKPNEVVVVLDGDDTLLHPLSLHVINQKYLDMSAWFTYGSYEGRWSDQIVDLPPSIRNGLEKFNPREQTWLYGHPRTFKVHLLDHITEHDFQFSDGNWLTKGTDRGFVYRMLELAGPDRIGYISKHIYKYEYSKVSSTLALVSPEHRAAQINHTMRTMEPSAPLNLDLHVVLLLWKRIYLLENQLKWLQDQTGLGGRRIHLHLVNNNPDERRMVDKIVENFKMSLYRFAKPMFHQLRRYSLMKITIKHRNGTTYHNFERFIYVYELRNEVPLDEVVFLDDDQYWHPTFLSSLIKEHRPKGMTTWYGKIFVNTPSGADYWNPTLTMADIVEAKKWPDVSSFKYGGTGGSIFDTNLWLLDSQLMRPYKDLSKWAKIDDLWSSYVLDALLGWQMRRLSPSSTIPIDIGSFHSNIHYHNQVSGRMSGEYLNQLNNLLTISKDVKSVGTWVDPTVDKQTMFEILQTKFMWDIETLS